MMDNMNEVGKVAEAIAENVKMVPVGKDGVSMVIGAVGMIAIQGVVKGGVKLYEHFTKDKEEIADKRMKKQAVKLFKKKGIIMCKQVEEDGVTKMVPIVGDDSE